VDEGEWLGTRTEVHSMMDLSDGLASDLVHILRASGRNADGGLSAEIELTAIPVPACTTLELAVAGGEDYKLLFTAQPDRFDRLAEDYLARFGAPLHPIGRIVPGPPEIVWLDGGNPVSKDWHGFTHF
jgi:thiamine-monophosphate kinase